MLDKCTLLSDDKSIERNHLTTIELMPRSTDWLGLAFFSSHSFYTKSHCGHNAAVIYIHRANSCYSDHKHLCINALPTQLYQWPGPSLVHEMTCHLFALKWLPNPMVIYWQLLPKEQNKTKEFAICYLSPSFWLRPQHIKLSLMYCHRSGKE